VIFLNAGIHLNHKFLRYFYNFKIILNEHIQPKRIIEDEKKRALALNSKRRIWVNCFSEQRGKSILVIKCTHDGMGSDESLRE
jgi:hypothetical protein